MAIMCAIKGLFKSIYLRRLVARFDGILSRALDEKYARDDPRVRATILEFSPIRRWGLRIFLSSYLKGDCYPIDRLEKLLYNLMDIKLQLYYILEVDLGLSNRLVIDRGYDSQNPLSTPHLFMTRLSLDQTIITKSRILWERILNFVYFLETGEDLDNKVSRKKSKKKVFFDFIRDNPKWSFLEPYESEIDKYDAAFRTPEVHKYSILRAELMGKKQIDPNSLLDLINHAMNAIWENIISIVSGGRAVSFTQLHMDSDTSIDSRYLS